MKQPIILYRETTMEPEEFKAASKYFSVTKSRMHVFGQDLVIGRYSVLPFYKELEYDLLDKGAVLINSFKQHNFVADLRNYYEVLQEKLTPKTWFSLESVPEGGGPFVLKGATNSRKDKWNTHCFATNKKEAIETYLRLSDDSFIAEQDIYIRQYVPLKKYMEGIRGLPVTDEYRFFVCNGEIVSGGFYWSNFIDDIPGPKPSVDSVPKDFLNKVIRLIGNKVSFYALDVAQTESGNWIVIELNDGQMSGLSCNDPDTLYKNLKDVLWTRHYKIPL